MPKVKINMLRGKVIRGTPSRSVPKGIIEIDTDDPKQKDLLHLIELAESGAKHMGRKMAEFVVDGPNFTFTQEHLRIVRMAPPSAYPQIAAGLAAEIGTSPEAAAQQLAQALDIPMAQFLPPEPAADEAAGTSEHQFSPMEIAELEKAEPKDYRQIAIGFAGFRGIRIEDAAAELAAAVGHPWPIDAPVEEAAPEAEPKSKKAAGK